MPPFYFDTFSPINLRDIFQIVETRHGGDKTTLRLNGEKYSITGTEERLLFRFEDLMISVGGFLGLFIGLSLNDVISVSINFVESINKKFLK